MDKATSRRAVRPSEYARAGTSPVAGDPALPATMTPRDPLACRECGKPIPRPRRNQRFCSKACNHAHRARKRRSNAAPVTHGGRCRNCGEVFSSPRPHARFCTDQCRVDFNNYWKTQGPRLADALFAYRVAREPGALTDLCRTFTECRHGHKTRVARKRTQK